MLLIHVCACSLLLSTEQCTRCFFNITHQVKAISIAIAEANPLVEIISMFLFSSLYTYLTYVYANYIKRKIHPYSASLYCIQFSLLYILGSAIHKYNFLV